MGNVEAQDGLQQRAHPDLNQGPADLQSAALTTELCTHLLWQWVQQSVLMLPRESVHNDWHTHGSANVPAVMDVTRESMRKLGRSINARSLSSVVRAMVL